MFDVIRWMDQGYDAKEAQQWPVFNDPGSSLDRSKYITASEIGYCARKIIFDKMALISGGYKPDVGTKNSSKDDWGFFERGHTMEAWAVDLIHKGNPDVPLIMTGKNQKSFVDGVQSGTPDGVFLPDEGTVGILEIKSIDPRTNTTRLPKLEHPDQVMQNLDLVATNMDRSPIGGVILYVDASNYKKRLTFPIKFDQAHAERLEQRADWLMGNLGEPANVPAEGLFKDHCKFCAHTRECSEIMRNEKGTTNDELKTASGSVFG